MRREPRPSTNHVGNADLTVGISGQGAVACRGIKIEDVDIFEQRQVVSVDLGDLDERLCSVVRAGINSPSEIKVGPGECRARDAWVGAIEPAASIRRARLEATP